MLADVAGIGEWGFAALVEVDGYKVLYDTGARPETVLKNAEELKIDLSQVRDVILSHNHDDHTGGLMVLRHALQQKNPAALSRLHVATGITEPRRYDGEATTNTVPALMTAFTASGGEVIVHDKAAQIAPNVWLTGPVARRYPEHNWDKGMWIVKAGGDISDTVPEDMSLVVRAREGLIVLTGCGHAGIGNILAHARRMLPGPAVHAVVGGLHLFEADDKALAWTAQRMREAGVRVLLGGHCTGIEAVYRLRALIGLGRKNAVVAAVGSSYASGKGIDPLDLAR
jgi:7,8-dihydropterin-6-yl-methyl-4-(beta-D-ribofuranosyl)aminobenzene 5'-phosphate synthase